MPITNSLDINVAEPLESQYGGTGVSSPTTKGVLVAQGSSPVQSLVLTDGQLLIGSSGANPAQAQLTPLDGVQITNAAGSISLQTTPNAKASMPFNFLMMGG